MSKHSGETDNSEDSWEDMLSEDESAQMTPVVKTAVKEAQSQQMMDIDVSSEQVEQDLNQEE